MAEDNAVLVVEDDEALLDFTRTCLEAEGYEVTTATDAPEALTAAAGRPEPFALVITNVALPRMNGPALVQQLARLGRPAPVLYVSTYSRATPSLRRLLRDRDLLLVKPFAAEHLLGCVRMLLGA